MTLREILRQAAKELPDKWLYLPGNNDKWSLDTEAYLLRLEINEETSKEILPDWAVGLNLNLRDSLDTQTVTECIQWADRLAGRPDDDVRFESFIYYVRFDAFLPKMGAPDPPPADEIMRKLDLEFYQKLGPEDLSRPCRKEGCGRGTIPNSVLCKRHHFEMIKRRACPFDN